MVELMRGIILRDASPIELWPNVVALVVMCGLLMALTVRRFRKVSLA
jgi:hypothetical protein